MRQGQTEILIVDNDDRIVDLVAWFLKKRGFDVRTAASFEQARVLIRKRRPDLMLSDELVKARRSQRGLGASFVRQLIGRGYMEP